MLAIKNTLCCPGCAGILRVSAQVVCDGRLVQYYLCGQCSAAVRQDPRTQAWTIGGSPLPEIPELVRLLTSLAIEDWRELSGSRASVVTTRAPARLQEKARPAFREVVLPGEK